uniref:Uncharacterized protein n=1 Tax=mine drainage metagenome TaxID=410659 RepID=E6Q013_9ZZZZ
MERKKPLPTATNTFPVQPLSINHAPPEFSLPRRSPRQKTLHSNKRESAGLLRTITTQPATILPTEVSHAQHPTQTKVTPSPERHFCQVNRTKNTISRARQSNPQPPRPIHPKCIFNHLHIAANAWNSQLQEETHIPPPVFGNFLLTIWVDYALDTENELQQT